MVKREIISRTFINLLFLFFIFQEPKAQNLVANGSFEDENICTEYHINCSPEGWISTSDAFDNYVKDPRIAFDGVHCVAFIAGTSDLRYYRSLVRSQLVCKMRKNKHYQIQFYVRSRYPIVDSVGILFTKADFLYERNLYYKLTPSVYANDAIIKPTSDTSWQKIVLDYEATGDENFLAIGNFSKRDITGKTGIPREKHFLVLIDNISIFPLDKNEKICADAKTTIENIYNQNERHEYLFRLIDYYRKNPPEPPAISYTISAKADTIIIPDVLFKTGSYVINTTNVAILDTILVRIQSTNLDSLVIEGHTDSIGSVEHNEKLSLNRAIAVLNYLNSKGGISGERLIVRGLASRRPVATNQTAEGRRKNRRVEAYLYTHD